MNNLSHTRLTADLPANHYSCMVLLSGLKGKGLDCGSNHLETSDARRAMAENFPGLPTDGLPERVDISNFLAV
jgi:hypothetical protein